MYWIHLPLFVLVLDVCVISSVSDPIFSLLCLLTSNVPYYSVSVPVPTVVAVFILAVILYHVTDAVMLPFPTPVMGFSTVFVTHICLLTVDVAVLWWFYLVVASSVICFALLSFWFVYRRLGIGSIVYIVGLGFGIGSEFVLWCRFSSCLGIHTILFLF